MGLDLGEKTIGVAVSDAIRMIASPLELIRKSKFTLEAEQLFKLMAHRKVSALVIGLPVNMDGTEGPRAQSCRAFARNLERLRPVNVAFWDERLSTSAVERFLIEDLDLNRKRRAEVVDRTAAAWILQGALDGPAYTSVFQGVIRWNSFVFVPVIQSVYGSTGTAMAAVAIAFIIPVTNITCVAVLAKWGALKREPSVPGLAKSMIANPILLACLIGLGLNLLRVPLIPGLSDAMDLLGAAALPLGLIVAGAGLSFAEVRRRQGTIAAVTLVKLGVMPPLMWLIAWALGGDSLTQGVALICGAAPGSAASYMLARQMGGDAPLIAGIIASTTVGSAVVIPMLLALFHFV